MAIRPIPAEHDPWYGYGQDLDAEIRTGRLSDTALRAASAAVVADPLAKLTSDPVQSHAQVSIATPAAGESVTVHTFTGAGTVRNIWMTIESGSLVQDAVLEVFVDGETAPSIAVDFGTLFLTALDAHTGPGGSYGTDHLMSMPVGSARPGAMSGALLFPVPYSNGCVIKVRAPLGANNPGGQLFTQIVNQPAVTSPLRLRSKAITQLSKLTAYFEDRIPMVKLTGTKGHLVWLGFAATGAGGYAYLERQWYIAVNGEPLNISAQGAAYPSFATSGGEDLFLTGWYFGFKPTVNLPWAICTTNQNAAFTCCAAVDLLAAYGGIPFDTGLEVGWSLKDGGTLGAVDVGSHSMSYVLLYYVDTTDGVPAKPTISDTFSRHDDVNTMKFTETGEAWQAALTQWGIIDGQAYCRASGGSRFAVVDAGRPDCTISVKIINPTDAGLAFRYVDDSNQFGMNLTGLGRRIAGTYATVGTFSQPFVSGDIATVVLNGPSITVKRNGTTVLTVTDTAHITSTRHGLTTFDDTGARFDDFTIT